MGSARMPGKSMAALAGAPALSHIIARLRSVPTLDGVVIATTTLAEDDSIADCAQRSGAEVHRGSEHDVLGRTLQAARQVQAATVVLVTGDSPLIDPAIVQRTIAVYFDARADFASNRLRGYAFPIGMDTHVCAIGALEVIARHAREPRHREHVTLYFYDHPDSFRMVGLDPEPHERRPELRLTLDTPADYELISRLFDALWPAQPLFGLGAVLASLEDHPELQRLNSHVEQIRP
jgi:spore coat polysaccharide biosynthesis protein SpsF